MIDLDLIQFADLTCPIDIANEIFHQNNELIGSVPLEKIALATGISEIQYKELNSFAGSLIANDAKTDGIIIVNSKSRHHRQRFTIGHELGHFMIPRHGHNMSCTTKDLQAKSSSGMGKKRAIEVEANQFSAELLMPVTLLKKQGAFLGEPSINNIKSIATTFDVSFQASAIRFADKHDYLIAIVISHKGKIVFGYARNNFPFWLQIGKKDDPIPITSLTSKMDWAKTETIVNDE